MEKYKKSDIVEIIDGDDNLIGTNSTPSSGPDMETQANGTTDANVRKRGQNFKNDFLGRFGFYFYEAEDKGKNVPPVVMDLAKLMYDKYIETLEYYAQNPEKLQKDMELHSEVDFTTQPEDSREHDFQWAWDIMDTVKPHFEDSLEGSDGNISEGEVVEDHLTQKSSDGDLKDQKKKTGLKDKKIEDVAELLKKLPKNEIDKLIKLLENR